MFRLPSRISDLIENGKLLQQLSSTSIKFLLKLYAFKN